MLTCTYQHAAAALLFPRQHALCVCVHFTSCRLSRPPPHLSVLASILPRVVLPVPIMPMR